MPDPSIFSDLPDVEQKKPPEQGGVSAPGGSIFSDLPSLPGEDNLKFAPSTPENMTPKVDIKAPHDQALFGLPQEATDIPIAGFFLNQRTYQAPTKEEAYKNYQMPQERDVTPLAPLGITTPIKNTTPVIGGIAEAIADAEKQTTPEYADAGIRDLWGVGTISRAGEAALNLLNQSYKTVGEPLAGLASIPLRGLSKAGEGWDAASKEMQKASDEALSRINEQGGIDRPTDMVKELGAIQEFGRSALAGTPAVYKFVAPMVSDPLTYVGGGLSKVQEAKLVGESTVPLSELSKMSALERIVKYGTAHAPMAEAGEILPKEALGMEASRGLQKLIPWSYTNRAAATDLVKNSIGGLIARANDLDAPQMSELIGKIKEAAASNSIQPIKDAFPEFARAFESYEGQRLIRSLSAIDTARSSAIANSIPDVTEETMKYLQEGSLGAKPSELAKTVFNKIQSGEVGPKTGEDLRQVVENAVGEYSKYKMLVDATDTIGKAAADAFKLSPNENLFVQMRDRLKMIEANLFIGLSPATVVNNFMNNTGHILAHGLRPFGFSEDTMNMLKAIGMEPGSAYRDVESSVIRNLVKNNQIGGYAGGVSKFRIPTLLNVYSKVENAARETVWSQGVKHALSQALKISSESMPKEVMQTLSKVDPELPNLVKSALRSGYNKAQVSKMIGELLPVTIESQVSKIARGMGMGEEELSAILQQSEQMGKINQALKSSKNADEFAGKAKDILDELRGKIEKVREYQQRTEGHAVPKDVKDSISKAFKVQAPSPTGTIKTVEDLRAQSVPFGQYPLPSEIVHEIMAVHHWGEDERAVSGVHRAASNWIKNGTQNENILKRANDARKMGNLWPDAATEAWQLKANAAFQALGDPNTPDWLRGYYEGHLRTADALIKTINGGAAGRGLDFEQLATGPVKAELRKGGELESLGSYVADYYKRTTGTLPPVATRSARKGVSGTTDISGAIRPNRVEQVPPPTGGGGAGGITRARPDLKQLLASKSDSELSFYSGLGGRPEVDEYAAAARELLDERAGKLTASTEPNVANQPKPAITVEQPELKNAIQDFRDAVSEHPAAGGMDVGELTASKYQVVADAIEQMMPDLQKSFDAASKYGTEDAAAARKSLDGWLNAADGYYSQMSDAQIAARRIGDWYVQRNILNYQARTNLDDLLSWVAPFAYWPRATASNYIMESLNRPAVATNILRAKEALDKMQQDEGFPSRFKGSIKVPMPFASAFPFLSGDMFFDPLKNFLPVSQFITDPAKNLGFMAPNSTDIQNEIRNQIQAGTISAQDGETALKQQKGNPIWEQVSNKLSQDRKPDPLDVGSTIFSFHAPLDWANKALHGRPEDISYLLPASRTIKGGSAILKNIFPQSNIPMGGIDPEGALREKLGLPPGDPSANYYIDRMLASMSLDGSVSPEQARLAMIERKGPVYDMAANRAATEQGLGSFGFLAGISSARTEAKGEVLASQDSKEVSQLREDLVKKAGGDPVRMSYDEKKQLLQNTNGNDGKPLWNQVSQWYKDHPEYKSRMELFDSAEGRLSNWLSDAIWEKYNSMSALDRRMFSQQNPDFKEQFASKDTRQKPQNIPNSTLEKWTAKLGAYVPKEPTEIPTEKATIDQLISALQKAGQKSDTYKPQDPILSGQYSQWLSKFTEVQKYPLFQEYQKRLDAVSDVQTQYFDLPKNQRNQFLAQHPELKEYWAWSQNAKKSDPTMKEYFDWDTKFWKEHPDLAKLLGRSVTASTGIAPPGGYPSSGGGYSRQLSIRPYSSSSKYTGSKTTSTSSEAAWNTMVSSLGKDNPLVSKIEAWLTLEKGNADIYAGKNPDLAAWLSGKSQTYLDSLRNSYMYRLKHPPATVQGKRNFSIRYLKPKAA